MVTSYAMHAGTSGPRVAVEACGACRHPPALHSHPLAPQWLRERSDDSTAAPVHLTADRHELSQLGENVLGHAVHQVGESAPEDRPAAVLAQTTRPRVGEERGAGDELSHDAA